MLQLPPLQQRSVAATIKFIGAVPGALSTPSGGWTPTPLYTRYSESPMPGVPPLSEIMVERVGFWGVSSGFDCMANITDMK